MLAACLFISVLSPSPNGTSHRTAILSKIQNWFSFSRKMALDSISSSPGEAVTHLIGRGIADEMAAPLDSFIII